VFLEKVNRRKKSKENKSKTRRYINGEKNKMKIKCIYQRAVK
jgi:hypothetical protein